MWKSHESGGKNYMYGSPEMTPYQEVKAEPVKIEPEVKSTVQPHITI